MADKGVHINLAEEYLKYLFLQNYHNRNKYIGILIKIYFISLVHYSGQLMDNTQK